MGAHNHPQEAPKEDKIRHRRKRDTKEQEAAAKGEQTRPKRVPRRIWVGQKKIMARWPGGMRGAAAEDYRRGQGDKIIIN